MTFWALLLSGVDALIERLPLPRKKRKSKSKQERENW